MYSTSQAQYQLIDALIQQVAMEQPIQVPGEFSVQQIIPKFSTLEGETPQRRSRSGRKTRYTSSSLVLTNLLYRWL